MPRHRLSKLDLLQYALRGAHTELGTGMGYIDEEDEELLKKDIAEIKRRIKLVELAEQRGQQET